MVTRKQLLDFIKGCFPKDQQENDAYFCADCVYGPGCQEFEQVSVPIRWLEDCREYLEQNPRVLTLDEVITSDDKLMWLQYKMGNKPENYELFPDSPLADSADLRNVCFHSGRIEVKGLYGKQWRCWTEKPSVADAMDWGSK